MWKIRKLYIGKGVWRLQDQHCDAVTSPPKLFSDCLDLHLTPSRLNHFQAVMTFTLDALLRDAVKSVLDRQGILLLTPSGCYSWRRHLDFPIYSFLVFYIKERSFGETLKTNLVQLLQVFQGFQTLDTLHCNWDKCSSNSINMSMCWLSISCSCLNSIMLG